MQNNEDLQYKEVRAYPTARNAGQAIIFNNENFDNSEYEQRKELKMTKSI